MYCAGWYAPGCKGGTQAAAAAAAAEVLGSLLPFGAGHPPLSPLPEPDMRSSSTAAVDSGYEFGIGRSCAWGAALEGGCRWEYEVVGASGGAYTPALP